jgi:hypothetical protein
MALGHSAKRALDLARRAVRPRASLSAVAANKKQSSGVDLAGASCTKNKPGKPVLRPLRGTEQKSVLPTIAVV